MKIAIFFASALAAAAVPQNRPAQAPVPEAPSDAFASAQSRREVLKKVELARVPYRRADCLSDTSCRGMAVLLSNQGSKCIENAIVNTSYSIAGGQPVPAILSAAVFRTSNKAIARAEFEVINPAPAGLASKVCLPSEIEISGVTFGIDPVDQGLSDTRMRDVFSHLSGASAGLLAVSRRRGFGWIGSWVFGGSSNYLTKITIRSAQKLPILDRGQVLGQTDREIAISYAAAADLAVFKEGHPIPLTGCKRIAGAGRWILQC